MTVSTAARDLLAGIREELAPAEAGNLLVPLVAEGRLPRERLAALAGEEYQIIRADRRSFLVLAARFPDPPAGELFTGLAAGESLALDQLMALAETLGMDRDDLERYEPLPGCQAYPGYVSWLALNGARGDTALALIANFGAWGRTAARSPRPCAPATGSTTRPAASSTSSRPRCRRSRSRRWRSPRPTSTPAPRLPAPAATRG
jgi:hypothetical protein